MYMSIAYFGSTLHKYFERNKQRRVQKHLQKRSSAFRSRDKQLFVFWPNFEKKIL